ncbi:hypothetical protein ASE15_03485 [Oerskovia sp. Root22]|nr:hypothetical protein ASE15_03485 [Oerskovia sp. Root22]
MGAVLLATALTIPGGAAAVAETTPLVGAGTTTYQLATTTAVAENPLKGFLPFAPEPGQPSTFADPEFPHSMEWFYLPVDSVVTGEDTYDWTAVESRLDANAERGHQSVFRFYLDYPGQNSGIPDYLLGPDGISQERTYDFYDNDGRSFSPDYDDERVVSLIVDFITALGERYDGDPRIGFITAGLIGFWGEDHTYPMEGVVSAENPDGEDWMPSQVTRETIWNAWDDALDQTWLLARYPSRSVKSHGFGLHDDSFAYATLPTTDWHFLSKVIAEGMDGAWKHAPIGGELYPPLQDCIFTDPLTCPGAADEIAAGRDLNFEDSVTASHISWMMNHQAWASGYTGQTRERATAAAASLGYDLAATEATLTNTGSSVEVSLDLVNRGVAPFYYDWPAKMVLIDAENTILAETSIAAHLPDLLPGGTSTLTATLPTATRDLAGIRVAFAMPNVMAGGLPLRFANVTQDEDLEGYLTLGAVPAPPGSGAATTGATLELDPPVVAQGARVATTARHLTGDEVTFGLAGTSETLATANVVNGVARATIVIAPDVPTGVQRVEVRDGGTMLAHAELTVVAAITPPAPTPDSASTIPAASGPGGLAKTGPSLIALILTATGAAALGTIMLLRQRRLPSS